MNFFVKTTHLFFVLVFSLVLCKPPKMKRQFETRHVTMELERNHYQEFHYEKINTHIEASWNDLPDSQIEENNPENCRVHLLINLMPFEYPEVTVCLFKRKVDPVFYKGAEITIFREAYTSSKLFKLTQAVTGFIKDDPNSKASGFIINGNFYGQLRFYDMRRAHHVVLYIEPLPNKKVYDPLGKGQEQNISDPDGEAKLPTAILFEYIPRLNEKVPPVAEDYDDTAASPANSNPSRKGREAHPNTEDNIVHADKDVILRLNFKPAVISHNMFDTRRQETAVCELCIWLQPNFAQKFALSGSVQHGAAEILELMEFLNYIFRSTDFNQDGLPENIGFSIKSMLITDDVRVTTTGPKKPHAGKPISEDSDSERNTNNYMFSTNVNTVSTKSAIALATKHLSPIFESCCATIAFIYHNMAPAIATTNLRGLCTDKNVAVVSGLLQTNKLAKYDLFRGAFHALGHLFGAHHDDMTNARCHETTHFHYLNPFVMHPVQQLNVGMRPGSFRISPCTKDQITQFLASNGAGCLISMNESFCGNGLLEEGEKCDCGSLWQCHLREECCGEGDTFLGCKLLSSNKVRCPGPKRW